jgi:DNA-binding MarR family transcriptional regulator
MASQGAPILSTFCETAERAVGVTHCMAAFRLGRNRLIMSPIMRKSMDLADQAADAAHDEDVFEAVHAVMHLYRAAQYRGVNAGADELTHLEGKVLGFFAAHPGATQKDLSVRTGRDKGQLARLIGGLRDRGLLEATPDESDRRNLRLTLTAEGRRLEQVLLRRSTRLSEQAVATLDTAERRQLVALLRKVQDNLRKPS